MKILSFFLSIDMSHVLHTLKIVRPTQLLSYYIVFTSPANATITAGLYTANGVLPGTVTSHSGAAGKHHLDARVSTELPIGENVSLRVQANLNEIAIDSWGLFQ